LILDPQLPSFHQYALTDLVGFADAAYATNTKTCQLVSGYVIIYVGAAVAYKARLQSTAQQEPNLLPLFMLLRQLNICGLFSMIFTCYHQNQLLFMKITKWLLT